MHVVVIFNLTLFDLMFYSLQDLLRRIHSKFDRDSGVDCPNAILVLLLQIQELWMDIMLPTLTHYMFPYYWDQTQRSSWKFIHHHVAVRKEGIHLP